MLSSVSEVTDGDQFPIFATNMGDARKVAASVLKEYVLEDSDALEDKVTQYAAPSATGFSVQITDGPQSVWLILTPTGTFAAGTIVLPLSTNVVDKQEVLVNCTQIVTALTVTGNGATVTGAPTTLAANAFFRLRYDAVLTTWYRVG